MQIYKITVTKHNKRRRSENNPNKDDKGLSTPLKPRGRTHGGFTLGLASAPTAISHQTQSHPCANLHYRLATRNAQCLNPSDCCQHQTETSPQSCSEIFAFKQSQETSTLTKRGCANSQHGKTAACALTHQWATPHNMQIRIRSWSQGQTLSHILNSFVSRVFSTLLIVVSIALLLIGFWVMLLVVRLVVLLKSRCQEMLVVLL